MPALDLLQSRTISTTFPFSKLNADFTANGVSEVCSPFDYTSLGTISGPLALVDNLGCDDNDFPPSVNSSVALILRGNCTFSQKSIASLRAGALAAVIWNNESENVPLRGTLVVASDYVPTLGISQRVGEGLRNLLENNQTIQVSVSITGPPEPAELTCADLSDQGRAFSTVLSVFFGAIVSGLAAGVYAPLFSIFAVWAGPFRVVIIGVYQFASACVAIRHKPLLMSGTFDKLCPTRKGWLYRPHEDAARPTFWGWIGWTYMAVYVPALQALWLAENLNSANSSIVLSRALAVLVTVMPLTIESRAGYGEALRNSSGRASMVLFFFITATATAALGCFAAAELITSISLALLITGIFWSLCLTFVSFMFGGPDDQGEAQDGWRKILGGLAMGVLCGFLVGAPAIVTFVRADTVGATLIEYLSCSDVAWWRKIVAILP